MSKPEGSPTVSVEMLYSCMSVIDRLRISQQQAVYYPKLPYEVERELVRLAMEEFKDKAVSRTPRKNKPRGIPFMKGKDPRQYQYQPRDRS